ncbi:ComEA family DNA-binding protein [Gleimia hominis]|uniref:ComEA family DNA-binding protein n=1 Tax=Gleimia hominis TaxID=595468 RepID=UPI000C8029E9|nr:ComEA family DNA-binding protein [Gleimia hominis]WIK64888.1 ComEA family DNA-binding protein [Gleimia hominis]
MDYDPSKLAQLRERVYARHREGADLTASHAVQRPLLRFLPSPLAAIALVTVLCIALVLVFVTGGFSQSSRADGDADGASTTGKDADSSGQADSDQSQVSGPAAQASAQSSEPGVGPSGSASGTMVVQVSGAVKTPKVVKIPAGSRGVDAVDAAGGLAEKADLSSVNLAKPLSDGEHLHVAKVGEAPPAAAAAGMGGASAGPTGNAGAGCVNIQQADEATLQTLNGVGPALAKRILDYRASNPLRSPQDLQNVSGIGPKKFESLKEQLCP